MSQTLGDQLAHIQANNESARIAQDKSLTEVQEAGLLGAIAKNCEDLMEMVEHLFTDAYARSKDGKLPMKRTVRRGDPFARFINGGMRGKAMWGPPSQQVAGIIPAEVINIQTGTGEILDTYRQRLKREGVAIMVEHQHDGGGLDEWHLLYLIPHVYKVYRDGGTRGDGFGSAC